MEKDTKHFIGTQIEKHSNNAASELSIINFPFLKVSDV